jgi:hypothetical protein
MILVNVHFITVLLEFRSEQLKPINLDHETNTYTVKPVLCDLHKGTVKDGHVRQVVV